MDIRVKYKGLEETIKSTYESATLLDEQIYILNNGVQSLQDNWKGIDADTFYNSITSYLKELKQIPIFYREISTLVGNMNKTYQNIDDRYTEELKKSVIKHE